MQASNLDFAGLYTFPNPLSKVPAGAALQADNLVANKDGVAEIRRGIAAQGTSLGLGSTDYIDQWFAYQNRLLLNDTAMGLWYDSTGSLDWTQFSGTYAPPVLATKMRGAEANKNFYIATNVGVQKLSAYSSTPILSGVPPGLDGTGVLAGGMSGFLGSNEQCVYQIVFGYNDANGNLNLGNPSQRILVVNATGGADDVDLTFTVPQGLTTDYFYQIYRTPQTTYSATPSANVPPGAEPQLATQQQLVSGDISSLSVTYTDITPDALLGAFLYTNPSQQGALQNNDRPPLCTDMCVFSQMMFYANCQTLESTTFNLISVGSPDGIQVGDTITINGVVFTGASSQNNASQEFEVITGGTVAEDIDDTSRALIACINANASTTDVYAIYLSGYNDLPGFIELQAVGFDVATFYVTSDRGSAFSPPIPASGTSFASSNDSTPNGVYVSKVGQPEAVPVVNLNFVGGGDQPILRVLPLRDRVVVLKSDGIYVITGTTPSTLSITLLDSTIICIAPESAQLLNNSVYCMSNQGVVSITESGVTIQSRAIESDLLQLTSPAYIHFPDCCQAISYESERLYIMSMPTNPGDEYGTQVWTYNWVTNAWTHWPIDCASGLVNPADNLLYMGRPVANGVQFLDANDFAYQERKNYLYTDFMDDQYPVTITGVDSTGLIVSISVQPDASWIGYGFDQTNAGIAIITAVNTVSNTVTVDFTNSSTPNILIPWVNGAANIDVPIPMNLIYCPMTGGYPHYLKDWTRVNFWFNGGNFQIITAGFITDIQGTTQYLSAISTFGYGFGPFDAGPYGGSANYPQSIQTLVPTDVSKARWVQPTLALSFPQTRLSCLGVTASYEVISDVSG